MIQHSFIIQVLERSLSVNRIMHIQLLAFDVQFWRRAHQRAVFPVISGTVWGTTAATIWTTRQTATHVYRYMASRRCCMIVTTTALYNLPLFMKTQWIFFLFRSAYELPRSEILAQQTWCLSMAIPDGTKAPVAIHSLDARVRRVQTGCVSFCPRFKTKTTQPAYLLVKQHDGSSTIVILRHHLH